MPHEQHSVKILSVLLDRATEFILLLMKRLCDDEAVTLSEAASEVYYQTLNKYHTWYTSAAFTVVLKVGFINLEPYPLDC